MVEIWSIWADFARNFEGPRNVWGPQKSFFGKVWSQEKRFALSFGCIAQKAAALVQLKFLRKDFFSGKKQFLAKNDFSQKFELNESRRVLSYAPE